MSEVALSRPQPLPRLTAGHLGLLAIVVGSLLVWWQQAALPWAQHFPDGWVLPLRSWVGGIMKWLIDDLDFGLFTFREFTRSIAWLLNWPLLFAKGLLSDGFKVGGLTLPPVPWFVILGLAVYVGYRLKDLGLALLVLFCLGYLALFGRWSAAMQTMASIVVAVPVGALGGLLIGIVAARSPRLERTISPILDFMQTAPIFAYLVPVLFFFGFGPVAAMISTIIYAMPPMIRVTTLALRQVPGEIQDFGRMTGCTRRQMTWKVMVPAAMPGLMLGVNQVIMLSLNIVIIAAMIGAGGLGAEVLTAMRALKLGAGIEASVGIALMAIAIDRLSQAAAVARRPDARQGPPRHRRLLVIVLVVVAFFWVLATFLPGLQSYPKGWQASAGAWTDGAISAVTKALFDDLEAVKIAVLQTVMLPVKRFLVDQVPWLGLVVLLGFAGLRLGGWRLGSLVVGLLLFVAFAGLWEPAMVSVYLCGLGVVVAVLIGAPLGVLAAKNRTAGRIIMPAIDTLQTLPAFAYLIPAVMLFQNGDFTALLAIIAYAVVAPVRYTAHGLKKVPPALVEAAVTSGCTPRQRLFKVELPLALPEILLGVNQTIMLALSMLVITALVGTRDLGQEVYMALAKADTGRGLVGGAAVACLGIAADRLMQAWANARKRKMGLI